MAKNALNYTERRHTIKDSILRLKTGFIELDEGHPFLQTGTLTVVASKTSMGRADFLMQIAEHASIQNKLGTALFLLESSCNDWFNTLLSSQTGIGLDRIKTNNLDGGQQLKIIQIIKSRFLNSVLFLDETTASINEIIRQLTRLKADNDISLAIIDYKQLIVTEANELSDDEYFHLTQTLSQLAKQLNIAIILGYQLTKPINTYHKNRPSICDLQDSEVELYADSILFLYRDESTKSLTQVNIALSNVSPTGAFLLNF